MDDKAYSDTDTNNVNAPDPPAGALIVGATNLTGNDASKFTGCYFVVSGTSWTLYSRGGTQLATGTSGANGFTFSHDLVKGSTSTKIAWTISGCVYTLSNTNVITRITGGWSNNDGDDQPAQAPPSGTFQASAGGAEDADAVSSSASA